MSSQKTSPLIKSAESQLARRAADELEIAPGAQMQKWARGDLTLQEVKGYTGEELFHIAQHGFTLFLNGKTEDAQIVFEGLIALDPRNEYYYRALGVVYHRRGDAERAIKQFDAALKVAPNSVAAFVNRAEVHISRRDYDRALSDLERASQTVRNPDDAQGRKARALRSLLLRRKRR